MANNINTRTVNSTVLLNKITELSNRLKIISQAKGVGQTQHELIIEANSLLNSFFNQITDPLFNPKPVLPDSKPDVVSYNNDFNLILSDLKILFAELKNIATLQLSNFNFIISDTNRLIGRSKSIYSKLGDYILFSNDPNKDSIYYSDTFNNLDKVDYNSALLDTPQVNIDQDQGIITLPINSSSYKPIQITIAPVINNNSNGVVGNNYEAGAQLNNNIVSILDDNADTWFEYENVILNKNVVPSPLILDLTLNLQTSQIINFIRINPNNFGTKNSIVIDTIETSSDGKSFVSIKEDIPVAGFDTTLDDLFVLAPSSSKFAGQAMYTFTPRYAKFVHIVFKQTSPYTIIDTNGVQRDRYAIGIRDIEIDAIPFDSAGELISTTYQVGDEVKKVAVQSHQFPSDDINLVSIEHYVSGDEGLTWTKLTPTNVDTDDVSIPEILSFNTVDDGAIKTASPVTSLKYKAILKRNDDNFNNPTNFRTLFTKDISELLPVPNTSPFNLALNNIPIKGTIKLIDPNFGSRGLLNTRYSIGTGNNNALNVVLPFTKIKRDLQKNVVNGFAVLEENDPEEVRVNGELWSRGSLALATSQDKLYELDYDTGQIKFGNGTNSLSPSSGATIDLIFKPERLAFSDGNTHIATLDYATSNDKQSFVINRYGAGMITNEILSKQTSKIKLVNNNLSRDYVPTFSNTTIFGTEKVFVDGFSELVQASDYSIDYINGTIYSGTKTSTWSDITINYKFVPLYALDESEWDFVDGSNYTQIQINDTNFVSLSTSEEELSPGSKYLVLKNFAVVPNSIKFSGPNINTYFFKEVAFVDGQSELITAIQTTERIANLGMGLTSYTFRLPISSVTTLQVSFSDTTTFVTPMNNAVDVISPGQYYIDRVNNKVIVFTSSTSPFAGTVNYYYNDSMKTNNGLYSVNYKTGEIFTANNIPNGITVSYNYSQYIAQYKIARVVESTDFVYDDTTNTVTVAEREILKRINFNKTSQTNFYQILYRTNIDNANLLKALAPYYSPILRDYALKVITESSLPI